MTDNYVSYARRGRAAPGKIFVNYRRDDERSTAARIRDRLAANFGETNVFMDVDNLMAGQRFDRELEKVLGQTDVFLAVIGPRWLELLAGRQGSTERDYVREEIAGALQRGIIVIPVLIERTPLPRHDALPEDIRDFVLHQSHEVTHARFGRDVGDLVEAIRFARKAAKAEAGGRGATARWVGAAVLSLIVLGGGILVYRTVATDGASNVQREEKAKAAASAAQGEAIRAAREAERTWASIKDTTSIPALEAFREQYGKDSPVHDRLADARIEELKKLALAVPPKSPPPASKLTAEEKLRAERLLETGHKQLAEGNVSAARIFYRRSADAGLAAAALSLAATYDPAELARLGAKSVTPDIEAARKWYERARELGAPGIADLLSRLNTPESEKRGRSPRVGEAFRDCPDVCPEMVVVPAGSFLMGSPPGEEGRQSEEGPQHKVTIATPFAVGKFEVTFVEWDACVSAGGCRHRPGDEGWGRGRRPVINVSWEDITKEYLPWLSRKAGKTYRLLSEAEWEYVARAGTTTPFWWGASISTSQANYDGNYTYGAGAKGESRQKTLPVDSFTANPWGLYNVHGNVWEWVQDCWNSDYNGAPSDGSARTTGDCGSRVLRGGTWLELPRGIRSAMRGGNFTPSRYNGIGFRVARML